MVNEVCRRVLLRRRPRGAPVPDDFEVASGPLPRPAQDEVLVRTTWLSLDPYMRGRMNDGPSYASPVALGEPMQGECVGEVVESRSTSFDAGDRVIGHGGWQTHFVLPADRLRRVETGSVPASTALGVLGMPGMTAYAGLKAIGKPRAGETVVVGAASGAVGAVAGQIAKIDGCHVVGVAGGRAKCGYVVEQLGFDACLDRNEPDLGARLEAACPHGIDVYVELTGGGVFDAVFPLLNRFARVPVIGTIAHYNERDLPAGPDRTPWVMRQILTKRLHLQGMIVWDYAELEPDFRREVIGWIEEGRLRYREDVVDGFENAVAAFLGLLEGRNFGKLLVRVAAESR